jgi:hypothetical protein
LNYDLYVKILLRLVQAVNGVSFSFTRVKYLGWQAIRLWKSTIAHTILRLTPAAIVTGGRYSYEAWTC